MAPLHKEIILKKQCAVTLRLTSVATGITKSPSTLLPHLLRKVVTQFHQQILRRNFQLAKSAQHISGPDTFINNKQNLLVRMVI